MDKATSVTVRGYTSTAEAIAKDVAIFARRIGPAARKAARAHADPEKASQDRAYLVDEMRRLGARFGDLNRVLGIRDTYQRRGFASGHAELESASVDE